MSYNYYDRYSRKSRSKSRYRSHKQSRKKKRTKSSTKYSGHSSQPSNEKLHREFNRLKTLRLAGKYGHSFRKYKKMRLEQMTKSHPYTNTNYLSVNDNNTQQKNEEKTIWMYQHEWEETEAAFRRLEKQVLDLDNERNQLIAEKKFLKQQYQLDLALLKTKNRQLEKDLKDEKDLHQIDNQIQTQVIINLKKENESLLQEQHNHHDNLKVLSSQCLKIEKHNDSLQQENQQLKQRIKDLERINQRLIEKGDKLRIKISTARKMERKNRKAATNYNKSILKKINREINHIDRMIENKNKPWKIFLKSLVGGGQKTRIKIAFLQNFKEKLAKIKDNLLDEMGIIVDKRSSFEIIMFRAGSCSAQRTREQFNDDSAVVESLHNPRSETRKLFEQYHSIVFVNLHEDTSHLAENHPVFHHNGPIIAL
ncbi:MAG: hypothetical protein GY821_14025 [Gammaproteobacteria bacterium]|nr:hypothetical protein [Gammaproteobacteria bacterium]